MPYQGIKNARLNHFCNSPWTRMTNRKTELTNHSMEHRVNRVCEPLENLELLERFGSSLFAFVSGAGNSVPKSISKAIGTSHVLHSIDDGSQDESSAVC
jgi:hypothetical protein